MDDLADQDRDQQQGFASKRANRRRTVRLLVVTSAAIVVATVLATCLSPGMVPHVLISSNGKELGNGSIPTSLLTANCHPPVQSSRDLARCLSDEGFILTKKGSEYSASFESKAVLGPMYFYRYVFWSSESGKLPDRLIKHSDDWI